MSRTQKQRVLRIRFWPQLFGRVLIRNILKGMSDRLELCSMRLRPYHSVSRLSTDSMRRAFKIDEQPSHSVDDTHLAARKERSITRSAYTRCERPENCLD